VTLYQHPDIVLVGSLRTMCSCAACSNFGFQGMPLAVASLTALRTLRLVCHEPVGGGPEPVPRRCLFVQPPALGLARLPRLAYAQLDWRLQVDCIYYDMCLQAFRQRPALCLFDRRKNTGGRQWNGKNVAGGVLSVVWLGVSSTAE